MRIFLKSLALPLLTYVERVADFKTSPLPQMAERLKMIFGRYEIGTTRYIRKHLRGGTAFDVGANVGYYARLMSQYATEVYAFEPDPDNFKILQKNCINYPNIKSFNMAVCDRVGTIDFFKVPNSAMRHSLIDEGNTQKISVPCTSLDAFVSERKIRDISMIKIDTEGAEPMVFAGMQHLKASQHPVVIYEGDDPRAQAISSNGTLVDPAQAPWWGSRHKVTNLVLHT